MCFRIAERVFIHYREISGSSGFGTAVVGSTVGISVNFELEYDRDTKRYHAVKARYGEGGTPSLLHKKHLVLYNRLR